MYDVNVLAWRRMEQDRGDGSETLLKPLCVWGALSVDHLGTEGVGPETTILPPSICIGDNLANSSCYWGDTDLQSHLQMLRRFFRKIKI